MVEASFAWALALNAVPIPEGVLFRESKCASVQGTGDGQRE
jgi:hypothetical protein